MLDALGVVGAVLGSVQVKCLVPCRAGMVVLAEGNVRVAEIVEGVGDFIGVADVAAQGEVLLVMADGAVVVAGPTPSTRAGSPPAERRAGTWPSAAARTTASARPWPGSKSVPHYEPLPTSCRT